MKAATILIFCFIALYTILTSSVSAQGQAKFKVVLLPLQDDHIVLRKRLFDILDYNKVTIDSAKNVIKRIIEEEFVSVFSGYNTIIIDPLSPAAQALDSLGVYKSWSCFSMKSGVPDSPPIGTSIEDLDHYEDESYGLLIDSATSSLLGKINSEYHPQLLISISRFETITKLPFNHNTYTIIHGEAFNDQHMKVYGCNNYREDKLSKNMYFPVFQHYIRTVSRKFFLDLKENEEL